MPGRTPHHSDTLMVLRYDAAGGRLRVVVGDRRARLPRKALAEHAAAALADRAFVCHAARDEPGLPGDEICFVPRGDHCEVVSIRTNGWHRHHGDHRRGLIEILNDIAAAVARGNLHFLDDRQLATELVRGEEILACSIEQSGSLARARAAVDMALERHCLAPAARRRMTLCVSEASANIILHGGGSGTMSLRLIPGRLRAVISDRGPGLDFLNWTSETAVGDQSSMGYGYKLILDSLDEVFLHTGSEGTTLILDHDV